MSAGPGDLDGLLRPLAPRALAALLRRTGDFDAAEDAVQEALIAAAASWPAAQPDEPLAWLITVARRRMVDRLRADAARRRREDAVAALDPAPAGDASGADDTLDLMFGCCHPFLAPGAAIPLTLRAVGGLRTREIATAFLVPEATMAQRISRAKATLRRADRPFAPPAPEEREARLAQVLHVLYLVFNEGYATSAGPDLVRRDRSAEGIRLAHQVYRAAPGHPEAAGLLALMLLTEARRPARTGPHGELVPLSEQDRRRWDRVMIRQGLDILTPALRQGRLGEYQVQAAVAALHDQAPDHAGTDWEQVLALYTLLGRMTGNPMVALNGAVAAGMARGPEAGLLALEAVRPQLGTHHRFHAVRGHLLLEAGNGPGAAEAFGIAAAGTANLRERDYLVARAARAGAHEPA